MSAKHLAVAGLIALCLPSAAGALTNGDSVRDLATPLVPKIVRLYSSSWPSYTPAQAFEPAAFGDLLSLAAPAGNRIPGSPGAGGAPGGTRGFQGSFGDGGGTLRVSAERDRDSGELPIIGGQPGAGPDRWHRGIPKPDSLLPPLPHPGETGTPHGPTPTAAAPAPVPAPAGIVLALSGLAALAALGRRRARAA